jgi:ubiquinone/menaquinone biosynthesis C-methylase UbiE
MSGVAHLHPEPSTSYDPIADHYEQSRGGRDRADRLAAAVDEWLEPDGLLLDVGTGTGIVADSLQARGHRVVGVDVSEGMLRHAVPRLPGRIARADAQLLPLRSGSFDAVTFCWSLHHIGNARAALAEAARVGAPNVTVVAVSGKNEGTFDDIHQLMKPLEPPGDRFQSHIEQVHDGATSVGLTKVGESWFELAYEHSPVQAVTGIRSRHTPTLWDMDDAGWARLAGPVIDALLALPEPERPRPAVQRHRIMVFRPA